MDITKELGLSLLPETLEEFHLRLLNEFHKTRKSWNFSVDANDFKRVLDILEQFVKLEQSTEKSTMTLDEFLEETKNGKIFTVSFIKRTTGELRIMNCRRGVQKDLTGKGMSYDAKSKNLLTVWDIQNDGYRMINLDQLESLVLNGNYYKWNDNQFNKINME